MGGPNSGACNRKPGEWKDVEKSRIHKTRYVVSSRGLSGFPRIGDIGSAAYRRLLEKMRKENIRHGHILASGIESDSNTS